MKKIFYSILAFTFIHNNLLAQDEFDALRYGYTTYNGTARSMSIGNAMGSVGGDFSSLSINPAGIGIYRRGEFVFSPSFNVMTNNSTYLGNTIDTSSTKLNFSQFGLVLTSVKKGNAYKKSAW